MLQLGEKLDKDRFRRDLGNIEEAYKEMLFRLTGELSAKGTMNYDPVLINGMKSVVYLVSMIEPLM